MNDMTRIYLCRYCGCPEYYGEFRWLSAKMMCRACYKEAYEAEHGLEYRWDDLDGPRPSMKDYEKQEVEA